MNGPRLLVAMSTRVLPSWARDRYEAELDAELTDLNSPRQWRHTLAFAATIWPLRLEVLRGAAETRGFSAAPLHCLLGIGHRWRMTSTPDGQRYRRCNRCGLDDPRIGNGLPDKSAWTIAYGTRV